MPQSAAFQDADQARFAALSGDYNPMHMDATQARRTQAGAPVVHGVHLLLWSLDALATADPSLRPMVRLEAQFGRFVYVGERAEVECDRSNPEQIKLQIVAGGIVRCHVTVTLGDAMVEAPAVPGLSREEVPFARQPHVLSIEQMADCGGRLAFVATPDVTSQTFPAASRWLGAQRVAALAASSRLVGMVCPGLHSIFSGLSVEACADTVLPNALGFEVTAMHPRFRTVDMAIGGGGIVGSVSTLARLPPTPQASFRDLTQVVRPEEFAGSTVLVVGGSRGLGELTAKLAAAGGGRVTITYHQGMTDAESVAEEIRSGGGICEVARFDARSPAEPQIAELRHKPTHCYYFATSAIYRAQKEMFSADRFNDLRMIYVDAFWRLCLALRARNPMVSIFYPSTVFVENRPRGLAEYAMAKAAGEVLCHEMNVVMAPMRVVASRLPRMLTDQTASVIAVKTAPALDVLLPIIRQLQSSHSHTS